MNLRMKKLLHMATMLGGFVLAAAFVPNAYAGCANSPASVGALNASLLSSIKSNAVRAPQPAGSDIVGMWEVELVATSIPNTPPEGIVIDHGYAQWHSDGTEIMNSSRDPRTQSFCLGVWKKTGPFSYTLKHRAMTWTSDGTPIGPATILENVTLARRGDTFTGTFVLTQYNLDGTIIIPPAPGAPAAPIPGTLSGTRITPN